MVKELKMRARQIKIDPPIEGQAVAYVVKARVKSGQTFQIAHFDRQALAQEVAKKVYQWLK